MSTSSNDLFYTRLPVNEIPLSELLMEEHLFFKVPANWQVIITDVKNSTKAMQEGLHETVNLVATGSIVAVLNIVYKANLTVPFFFGGDGATFIVPPGVFDATMNALLLHRENTKNSFNMDLRVGSVSVEEIYADGHELNIGKLKTSQLFSIPVLLGDGLSYAEKKIKGPDYIFADASYIQDELDLSGMQCRWDRIKPPSNNFEIVSLLIIAREGNKQAAVFKKVIDAVDNIYGTPQVRKPISIDKLKIKATLAKIGLEMKVRMGGFKLLYMISNWIKGSLASYYFRTKKGKVYLNNLVELSDTLVIDGKINTVISGTPEQRALLETALDAIENNGEIYYGLFVSSESVMSCYVRNLKDEHVHFVDGAEGGYTKAATVIKKKLGLLQHRDTEK